MHTGMEFRIVPQVVEATFASQWLMREIRSAWSFVADDRERLIRAVEMLRKDRRFFEKHLHGDGSPRDPDDPNANLYRNLAVGALRSAEMALPGWYDTLPPATEQIEAQVDRIDTLLREAGEAARLDTVGYLARVQQPTEFPGHLPEAWETLTALSLGRRIAFLFRESFESEPQGKAGELRWHELHGAISNAIHYGEVIGRTIGPEQSLERLTMEIKRDHAELERMAACNVQPCAVGTATGSVSEGHVTIQQVARWAHLEPNSMSRYTKEWGPPVVRGSGRRPAQYRLDAIRPILERQFPATDLSTLRA